MFSKHAFVSLALFFVFGVQSAVAFTGESSFLSEYFIFVMGS